MPVSLAMKGDRLLFSGLKCACGGAHQVPTQDLYIARDAAKKLPRFLKKRDWPEGRAGQRPGGL
jgi:hypothetical protein